MNKPESQELRTLHATLCQAIADPIRISILYELGETAHNVHDIVTALDLPQATVSRHLRILRSQSLVKTRRDGSFIYYSLTETSILDALNIVRKIMQKNLTRQHNLLGNSSSE